MPSASVACLVDFSASAFCHKDQSFFKPTLLSFRLHPSSTDSVVVMEEGGRGKRPDSDPDSPQLELEATSEPIFMSADLFKPTNATLSRVSDRTVGGTGGSTWGRSLATK